MAKIIKTKSFELAVYMKGKPNTKKLALLLPGKLDTKDYPHMRSHVDYLAKKGYLAVSFDPPGTWESPGGLKLYNRANYLKAINELIDYFGNRPTVLMGHSRGGSMAMLTGTQNNNVTHIIAIMSFAKMNPVKRTKQKFKICYRDNPSGGKKKFKLPLNRSEEYNALDALASCTKPKLFILGTKDKLVTPESVRKTYNKSADPKQLCEVDSGHDYRFHPEKIQEINQIAGKFLEKK